MANKPPPLLLVGMVRPVKRATELQGRPHPPRPRGAADRSAAARARPVRRPGPHPVAGRRRHRARAPGPAPARAAPTSSSRWRPPSPTATTPATPSSRWWARASPVSATAARSSSWCACRRRRSSRRRSARPPGSPAPRSPPPSASSRSCAWSAPPAAGARTSSSRITIDRQAARGRLTPEQLQNRHRALAEALERRSASPWLVVHHWLGAAEPARAAPFALAAAVASQHELAARRVAKPVRRRHRPPARDRSGVPSPLPRPRHRAGQRRPGRRGRRLVPARRRRGARRRTGRGPRAAPPRRRSPAALRPHRRGHGGDARGPRRRRRHPGPRRAARAALAGVGRARLQRAHLARAEPRAGSTPPPPARQLCLSCGTSLAVVQHRRRHSRRAASTRPCASVIASASPSASPSRPALGLARDRSAERTTRLIAEAGVAVAAVALMLPGRDLGVGARHGGQPAGRLDAARRRRASSPELALPAVEVLAGRAVRGVGLVSDLWATRRLLGPVGDLERVARWSDDRYAAQAATATASGRWPPTGRRGPRRRRRGRHLPVAARLPRPAPPAGGPAPRSMTAVMGAAAWR